MGKIEHIALFDLDGTLADYDAGLLIKLNKMKSPEESEIASGGFHDMPNCMQERISLIKASAEWWANLPKFQLGFDVLGVAEELGYRKMILTQGPRKNSNAWSGKVDWIDKNIGEEIDITITRDKGLTYGRVLVDDYPPYVKRWFKWRKRGLVIMPAQKWNEGFEHPRVIRYDGSNLDEVRNAMIERKSQTL